MQEIQFLIAVVILSFLTYIAMRTPSHDRDWSDDQAVLPSVSTYGPMVTIHNMRQARYRATDDYTMSLGHMTFGKNDIVRAWILIEPFGSYKLFGMQPAHVLVSFELADGRYISVSPEIRKRRGQTFSALRSFARYSEIMYVVADEEDVIKLRTNHRKDDVWLYPLALSAEQTQKLFENISSRINKIHAHAAFFNSAIHNCATNITSHLRTVGAQLPKFHHLYLLPAKLDALLYKKGLIDTSLPLEEARRTFYITKKAQKCSPDKTFSMCIR